jgi:hypothetical protein
MEEFRRAVESEWRALAATALNSTKEPYMSNMSVSITPDRKGIQLRLGEKPVIVPMVEKGVPAGWDLRKTILKGRPKRSFMIGEKDNGGRWVTISARVKGWNRDSRGRMVRIHEDMPMVGVSPYRAKRTVQRLFKQGTFQNKKSAGKFTSWWHPGIDARHLMRQVKNKIATDFPNLVRKYNARNPAEISKSLSTDLSSMPYAANAVGPTTTGNWKNITTWFDQKKGYEGTLTKPKP